MLSLDTHYKPLYVYTEPNTRRRVDYQTIGKRGFDICFSLLVTLFILSWLLPLLGMLIKLDSPGPILYIQKRTGYKGTLFDCLKFRTMLHSTTPQTGYRQTSRDDARVTPIGRFLRKTNLDEMPQFLNVLMGDMTIVGPRPHAVWHDAQHWGSTAYRERYWVRPGITGLAQIRGARGEVGETQKMDHRIRYDHFYIPRQTFLLDMKICLWTLKLMFKGDINAW